MLKKRGGGGGRRSVVVDGRRRWWGKKDFILVMLSTVVQLEWKLFECSTTYLDVFFSHATFIYLLHYGKLSW